MTPLKHAPILAAIVGGWLALSPVLAAQDRPGHVLAQKFAEGAAREDAKRRADDARRRAEAEETEMLRRARAEAEARKRAADKVRADAEARDARDAEARAERARHLAEEQRRAREAFIAQRTAEAERQMAEEKAKEARRLAEERAAEERRAAEESKRLAEERDRQAAEARRLAEERAAAERRLAEQKAVEERRVAAERKAAEDRRLAEEAWAAEQRRQREAQVAADRQAAEARRLAEERAAAERRLAEQKAVEERRVAAERKAAEDRRLAEEAWAAEQRRQRGAHAAAEQQRRLAAERADREHARAERSEEVERPRETHVLPAGDRMGLGVRRPTPVLGGSVPRVTVLLVMAPGETGIRRFGRKTADPVLCAGPTCWISGGSGRPAEAVSRGHALGPGNTLGPRAAACNQHLACAFREVETAAMTAAVQPIDLRILRHDRRAPMRLAADPTCRFAAGALSCERPFVSRTWRAWVVPEAVAREAGVAGLEAALVSGLRNPRVAATP